MCQDLYNETRRSYNKAVLGALPKKKGKDKLLYFNFKSHNILNPENAERMFEIIKKIGAENVCLSEALVPNTIAATNGTLVELQENATSTIVQPHDGDNILEAFKEKKRNDYRELPSQQKATTWPWEARLWAMGYRYLIFANPATCPWGANWGNVMVMKSRPTQTEVRELGTAEGKRGFGTTYNESRNAIGAKLNDGTCLFTTHLENSDKAARCAQAQELATFVQDFAGEGAQKTLVGDINSLHLPSYTKEQQQTLKKAWWPPLRKDEELPHEATDILSKEAFKAAPPVNAGQTYESLYQKCVTHGWSTRFAHSAMYFTDVSAFDHQPLILFGCRCR